MKKYLQEKHKGEVSFEYIIVTLFAIVTIGYLIEILQPTISHSLQLVRQKIAMSNYDHMW